MRDQQSRSVRFISLLGVALAVGALFALSGPAAAAAPAQARPSAADPDTSPVRLWSVNKIEHGVGPVPVSSAGQVGGKLQESVDVGPLVFNLPLHAPYWYFLPRDRAFGSLFSNDDGRQYSVLAQAPAPNPIRLGTPAGAITHLDEYQAYQKQDGDASLRITLSDLLLQTVDDSNSLPAWECPSAGPCDPVRTVVRFHARAYAASAGGDFFDAGGVAYLEGHQHSWSPGAATSADSAVRLWGPENFKVDGDADDSGTGAAGAMFPTAARSVKVPLDSVRRGELFAVHVSLEAEAVDDRDGETDAQAFIQDPQNKGRPGLLTAHGLKARGKPRFKEPRVKPVAPAGCPKRVPGAGAIQFSDTGFTASEAEAAPMVLVTRRGGTRGAASVTVTTRAGTARAGRDFKQTSTTVRFASGDPGPRLVEVPLREDSQAESPETFTVGLSHARCAALGARHRASVTIVDDDQLPPPPPPPAPTFTIGGTVDGLQGSGLVLTNLGPDVPVPGNGTFTFPGTATNGQPYEIAVRSQPTNPAQVCTVQNGNGTVGNANVTDIAVHCAAPFIPLGLDTSFGTGGIVSTPVGVLGQGEAVVIQPTGGIVTAGWRTASTGGATDFALTRHDQSGNLDHTFGADGIATTDLGGDRDQAFGAAVLPDNGIVAVGRTNALGILKTAFGVVRYLPGGTPNQNFGNGGIVTTPFAGKGAQANAVAVQPDGKIVVAGFAKADNGVDSDFAAARYNPDGSPDDNFGDHGITTTDLGTENDAATRLAIQSDGKIVLAGNAGEDVGLVRLEPNGVLDPTFGNLGKSVTKIGLGADVNGVALDSDGGIRIAGSTVGAISQNWDFLLAGFRADGTLNPGFGQFGFVTTDFGDGDDFAENLLVDDQGEIVLVGRASSDTITDLALATYKPDGSLADFGRGGIFTVDFHGRGDFGQDLVIDSQNRIIAAGGTADGGDTEFALTRVFR